MEPTEPSLQRTVELNRTATLDEIFLDYAAVMPGFAGMYFEGATPIVRLVDPAQSELAAQVLDGLIRAKLPDAAPINVLEAEYSWQELAEWRNKARSVLGWDGVTGLDIAERQNRIVVKVADEAAINVVSDALADLEIPADSREVVVRARPPTLSLRDRHRPVQGGLVTEVITSDTAACTIGFNVDWYGDRAFLTNAHCTPVIGTVTSSAVYYQDSLQAGNRIGQELIDPAPIPYDASGDCHYKDQHGIPKKCRYSDAALIEYDDSVTWSFGHIARPVNSDPDSSSYATDGRFWITTKALAPIGGESVHKVGQVTGWTYGAVGATCEDVVNWQAGLSLLCQTVIGGGVKGGDSGSPAFQLTGGGTVRLVGIVWGGWPDSLYISPIAQIERDLGYAYLDVETSAPTPPSTPTLTGPSMIQPGATCTWFASSSGTTPIQYQWTNDGIAVGGGTSYTGGNLNPVGSTFQIEVTASNDAGWASASLVVTEDSNAMQCFQ